MTFFASAACAANQAAPIEPSTPPSVERKASVYCGGTRTGPDEGA
jgi:hypothetical protein